MLQITRTILDSYPHINKPIIWRISSTGDFIWSGIKSYSELNSTDIVSLWDNDPHLTAELHNNNAIICRFSTLGWKAACADLLATPLLPEIHYHDTSVPLSMITAKYLHYRSSPRRLARQAKNIPKDVPLIENCTNPVYLQWYAFSYSYRWLNAYLAQRDHCHTATKDRADYNDHNTFTHSFWGTIRNAITEFLFAPQITDTFDRVDKLLLARYIIIPQIIDALPSYQCHHSEQLACGLLKYLPGKPQVVEYAIIAALGAFALAILMSYSGIIPKNLI